MVGGYDVPAVTNDVAELLEILKAGNQMQATIRVGLLRLKLEQFTKQRSEQRGGPSDAPEDKKAGDLTKYYALLASVRAIEAMVGARQTLEAAEACARAIADWAPEG